jgi:hypothetical protein
MVLGYPLLCRYIAEHPTLLVIRTPHPSHPHHYKSIPIIYIYFLGEECEFFRILLSTYSKGLARGVAKNGVRVTMISPGFIETSGAHGMIMDISKGTGVSEEAARQQIMDMLGGIPVGRPGTPEEVQIYRSRFSTYQLQIGTNRITAVRQAHCDWSCPELGTATTRPHRDFLKED